MHQTRANASIRMPIPRKGTRYVARASHSLDKSVPVVVAIRDMLNLARTSREVQKMIHQKLLKINGRVVKDLHEGIQLFSILEADKKYKLTLLETGRFGFEETKEKGRIIKLTGKKVLGKNVIQYHFHDGTNLVSKDAMNIDDSLEIDFNGKIIKKIGMEKGKEAFVSSGKSAGKLGKIQSIENGEVIVEIDGRDVRLNKKHVIVI